MTIQVHTLAAFKVRPVNNGTKKADRNRYCGPAVLSAMSGITTADASRLIRTLFPDVRSVRGTSAGQINKAFDALGINMDVVAYRTGSSNPTLAGWLKQTVSERTPGRVFLLVAGNHWQIVTGRRYVCGIVKDVVSIKDKRIKRRARVTAVYELTPSAADGKLRIPTITAPAANTRVAPGGYRNVRKLVNQHADIGLHYDIDPPCFHGDAPLKWVGVSNELENLIHEAACEVGHEAHMDASTVNDERAQYDWDEVEACMIRLIDFARKWGHLA